MPHLSVRATALLALLLVLPAQARAQSPAADVMAVVNGLFDAMRAGDSTAVRAAFHPQGRLFTTAERNGGFVLRETSAADFAGIVGQEGPGILDERPWNPEVRVEGLLASAWMPYAFYDGGAFSHCGVDAFQLVRTPEGWKILQLTYTMRREGCEIPPDIGRQ